MKVLHALAGTSVELGGLLKAVEQLSGSLQAAGIPSQVIASGLDRHSLGGADIVHIHGLWKPSLWSFQSAAQARDIPVVVSPHGMLEPWSLAQKRLKKLLALSLVQGPLLRRSRALHATSQEEARNLRTLGYDRVVCCPLGVELPRSPKKSWLGPNRMLFLSRIHPKKGLIELLEALSSLPGAVTANWVLDIAGWDEDGHWSKVRARAMGLGLGSRVRYHGPVAGEKKWELFRKAKLFVLPTHSENYGIVVAEAMGMGLPVLTTHGAPWPCLVADKSGWRVKMSPKALAGALDKALKAPTERLKAMGLRGRKRILTDYAWPARVGDFVRLYRNCVKTRAS